MNMPFAAGAARVCWTLPLGIAGVFKIVNPAIFQERILDFQVVGHPIAAVIALVLPWIEVSASVLAWMPRWSAAARSWALLCTLLFISVITQALIRRLDISCGCFGSWTLSLPEAIAIDMLLLAALAIDAWLSRSALSHRTPRHAPSSSAH